MNALSAVTASGQLFAKKKIASAYAQGQKFNDITFKSKKDLRTL